MANPCVDCGEELVFEINPDQSEDQIIRTGNRVIIPQRWEREEVQFHAMDGVDLSGPALTDPIDAVALGWNPATCQVEPTEWPCPQVYEWDRTQQADPDPAECEECADGRIKLAVETETGCVTHACVGGGWVCVGGVPEPEPEEMFDKVCYDLGSWVYPCTFGGSSPASGSWEVFGQNQMDEPCDPIQQNYLAASNLEYACWGDWGDLPGPPAGWNSLTWADGTTVANVQPFPPTVESSDVTHGCPRPAFRIDPGFPVGTSGPLQWDFDFNITSGANRFAAYDKISGQQLPVQINLWPNSGTVTIEQGPNGPSVRFLALAPADGVGAWQLEFSLPSGVQAENVCFLLWNTGNTGGNYESLDMNTFISTTSAQDCCNHFQSAAQVAIWLTANDPNGVVWTVDGNQVCTVVPPGVGGSYGPLSTCDCDATATVSSVAGDEAGTGSDCCACMGVLAGLFDDLASLSGCSVESVDTVHTGQPGGAFVHGCEPLGLGGQSPTAVYPPSNFPEFWQQAFTGGPGGQSLVAVVLDDGTGSLQWVQVAP